MIDGSQRRGRWLLAVAVLALGCGNPPYGDAWLRSFNAGRRATSAGRYEEAARLYEEAARGAVRPKDRDEARFMQARMMLRLERPAEARRVYERMLGEAPDGPRAPRVRFELARLAIASNDPRGWELLVDALVRHADDGAARAAVLAWIEHLRATGDEATLRARVGEVLARIRADETVQHLEYELGLSLERSGKLAEAHEQLLATARRHPLPHGNLTDDSYWRASHVAEALGDARLAIRDLEELLGEREVAWFGQSYERPKYPLARMRIAELYRDRVGDLRAARSEFERMAATHTTSILCDDARWQSALASLRLGEPAEACRAASELRERHPTTRYLACLAAVCPLLAAPAGGRECPDYLRAQLEPGASLPRASALDPEARSPERGEPAGLGSP